MWSQVSTVSITTTTLCSVYSIVLCSICGIDCSDTANYCMAKCVMELGCGHSKKVFCYQTSMTQECSTRCSSILECGHPCPGTCHSCSGARLHSMCGQPCGRLLVCGHVCRERCGQPCLCQAQCETVCGHSNCTRVRRTVCSTNTDTITTDLWRGVCSLY